MLDRVALGATYPFILSLIFGGGSIVMAAGNVPAKATQLVCIGNMFHLFARIL
jgi:hypothetical protein